MADVALTLASPARCATLLPRPDPAPSPATRLRDLAGMVERLGCSGTTDAETADLLSRVLWRDWLAHQGCTHGPHASKVTAVMAQTRL